MNKVVLIGRLTRDSELKFTPGTGTAVATFTLAVDRRFSKEKETDFINCVAWGKTAENTANYTQKGSLVGVSGRLQVRSYDAKDGSKRYVTEVVADEVQFLNSKKSSQEAVFGFGKEESSTAGLTEIEVYDEGEIPF